uniref:histidine kinase n=1 Tax=Magnetococcus massalia (strain MO-1) TaxID=451514 RepID=A0A1S7LG90_MAGMO|nr:putative hybrid histidine kinase with PAS domain and response regulator receiver domain [Candidatus Magnetococcus massalia]
MDEQKARLQEIVMNQARFIEAVYRFDSMYNSDYPDGNEAATISQIKEAHENFAGFGDTGEFTLARKLIGQTAQIDFILRHRHNQSDKPPPIPYSSNLAEPMRQALSGISGITIGLDYRGELVMAAHEPLPALGWGVVAKLDLAEVRAPFIRILGYWALFAILLVGVGTYLFYRVGSPIIRQLQASEADIKTTLNSIGDAVIACDCNSFITRMNPVAENLTGWRLEDAMGKPLPEVFKIVSSLTGETVASPMEKVLQDGVIVGLANHTDLIARDGSRIPIADSGAPIRGEQGQISGVVLVFRDVTEAYEKEKQLRESEARFRNLYLNAPIPYQSLDSDGRLISVNNAWLNTLGFTQFEQAEGKWFGDLLPESYQKLFQDRFPKFKERGETHNVEFEMIRADGIPIQVSFEGRVSRNNQGEFVQTHCLLTDITEKKQMEQQLRQAQKMEAVGALTGGIAHDFNNILGSIIGFNELARERLDDKHPVKSFLDHVHTGSLRAKELIAQLLSFSRQSDSTKTSLLLEPLVKETLKMIQATIPSSIEINPHLQGTSELTIHANATEIYQTLMNLCANAAFEMTESGGQIDISLEQVELDESQAQKKMLTSGDYVLLTVSDTGPGIPPENLNRIFDPFFTSKPVGEGTGLGLSVVHGIVKDCAGQIDVDSKLGQGTTFRIYLPLFHDQERESSSEVADESHASPASAVILLVDDEPTLVELSQAQLQLLGHQVIAHTESRAALSYFQENATAIDLVITDQAMPHLTGLDLIQKMRLIRPELPVIVCTGFSQSITPERIRQLGIQSLLMKPILKDDLHRAVQKALQKEA